jgi:hypothetical protein
MELTYIWDTNIVIYYVQNQFPLAGELFIDELLNDHKPVISVITEIELLSWKTTNETDNLIVNNFISNSVIYELDNQTLISRNMSDFGKISKLKIVNPFDII